MNSQTTIRALSIEGFRAFLKKQTFELRRKNTPLSLAVFAPNAKGKSSMVDGLEFFFHEDGTIERLGKKKTDNQAGPKALAKEAQRHPARA